MKKKIAIIGAGVAGLTLANFLKKDSNFEFMVYEKKESLSSDKGFGIQLAVNSTSILNKIGFNKINPSTIYHPKKLNIYSIAIDKICDLDLTKFNDKINSYTTLQRATLINFLRDEINTQHLRYGKRIQKISETENKILINFDDKTSDLVDYLIAADGIFSNTRSFFEGDKNKPELKKAIAIRTILNLENNINIDKKNINLILGANAHLVIYPTNNKKDLNLVCIIREKKFDQNRIRDIIDKKILSQNSNLKVLFKDDLKTWPLYSTKNILPSSNKKVFYLGDAFHGFLPTMAQGASQSIESAYELFNLLKENNEDIHNIYFKERSKRAKIIKKRSDFNFFVFHISNPIIKIFRNTILKHLVKNKNFISNYLGKVYKN
jgi:salicylate hydroxylase